MFKRSYFTDQFLPCLLKPRLLPDAPDAVMKFIQVLVDAKKIPPPLYQGYLDACQMEKLGWTEAAAAEEEAQEPEFSSSASPLELIEHQLDKYGNQLATELSCAESAGFRFSRSSDSILNEFRADVESVLRDLSFRPPFPRRLHFRLVDAILTGFCQTALKCHAAGNLMTPKARQWMTSFAVAVSKLTDIRSLLLTRLVELLTLQLATLDWHQVHALAMFLACVAVIEERFSVDLSLSLGSSLPAKSSEETFPHFLFSLPLRDCDSENVFRFYLLGVSYLDQVLNIHDDSEKLEAIPRILVSKLRWISRRLRFCYFDGAPLGLEPLPLQVCEVWTHFEALENCHALDFVDHITLDECIRFELEVPGDNDFLPSSHFGEYFVIHDDSSGGGGTPVEIYRSLLSHLSENPTSLDRSRRLKVAAIVGRAESRSSIDSSPTNNKSDDLSPLLSVYSAIRDDRGSTEVTETKASLPPPPPGLLTALFQLTSATSADLIIGDRIEFPLSKDSGLIKGVNRFIHDVIQDSSNRSSFSLPNDVALLLWESILRLPNFDLLEEDVAIALLLHLPFVRRGLSTDAKERLAAMLAKRGSLRTFEDGLRFLESSTSCSSSSSDASSSELVAVQTLSEKMKVALLFTFVRCVRANNANPDNAAEGLKTATDALGVDVATGGIFFIYLLLAEIDSHCRGGDSEADNPPPPYLSRLVSALAFLLVAYSDRLTSVAYKEIFSKKEMVAASGLVPKGTVKRSAVALVVALDLLFRDAEARQLREKLTRARVFQLVCVATKVMQVGGMVDAGVILVAQNLFKNIVADTPEPLRQHTEEVLAKASQAFLS